MAHTHTSNYDFTKPEVSSDTGAWGGFLNTDLDDIDTALDTIQTALDAEEVVGAAALPKAGGAMTGKIDLHSTRTTVVALGSINGANTITLANGDVYTATLTGATTFTFTPVSGALKLSSFILQLTNGGAGAVTWPVTVKWADGVKPSLTVSGVDLLAFLTFDAGTTWIGAALLDLSVPA
jgi:hypothetical protein